MTKKFLISAAVLVFLFAGFLAYSYYQGLWPADYPAEYIFNFVEPVSVDGELIIRNDSMGAGHFGASRSRGTRSHNGVDLKAPIGTPVFASERGTVETGNHPRGYGIFARIHHEKDYVTVYAHLSELFVQDGDFVERGEVIGSVGRTGNADYDNMEPHLHFEIRKEGVPIDPMIYLIEDESPALN